MFSSVDMNFIAYVLLEIDNYFYYYMSGPSENEAAYKTIYSNGLKGFESKCLNCLENYVLNDKGNCEELKINYDGCSFNSIIKNYDKLYYNCRSFCKNNYNNVIITLKSKGGSNFVDLNIKNFNNYGDFIEYFIG